MAKKRMFSPQVVASDAFLALPFTAQALYIQLNLEADDDGIIGAPLRITRSIGAGEDDLKALTGARFLLAFPSGVMVVKHWLINNAIKLDRYTPSTFTDERAALKIKTDNRAYTTKGKGISVDAFIKAKRSTNGAQAEHKRAVD